MLLQSPRAAAPVMPALPSPPFVPVHMAFVVAEAGGSEHRPHVVALAGSTVPTRSFEGIVYPCVARSACVAVGRIGNIVPGYL